MSSRLRNVAESALSTISAAQQDIDADDFVAEVNRSFRPGRRQRRRRSTQGCNHRHCNHLYADDTQLFLSFYSSAINSNITHLQDALQHISSWMTANLLTLNSSKTEFLFI